MVNHQKIARNGPQPNFVRGGVFMQSKFLG